MNQEDLDRLQALIDKLPSGLNPDWKGTNHYEMSSHESAFWLDVRDSVKSTDDTSYLPNTEGGQRLGLVMDAASALKNEVPMLLRTIKHQRNLIYRLLQTHEWNEDSPLYLAAMKLVGDFHDDEVSLEAIDQAKLEDSERQRVYYASLDLINGNTSSPNKEES